MLLNNIVLAWAALVNAAPVNKTELAAAVIKQAVISNTTVVHNISLKDFLSGKAVLPVGRAEIPEIRSSLRERGCSEGSSSESDPEKYEKKRREKKKKRKEKESSSSNTDLSDMSDLRGDIDKRSRLEVRDSDWDSWSDWHSSTDESDDPDPRVRPVYNSEDDDPRKYPDPLTGNIPTVWYYGGDGKLVRKPDWRTPEQRKAQTEYMRQAEYARKKEEADKILALPPGDPDDVKSESEIINSIPDEPPWGNVPTVWYYGGDGKLVREPDMRTPQQIEAVAEEMRKAEEKRKKEKAKKIAAYTAKHPDEMKEIKDMWDIPHGKKFRDQEAKKKNEARDIAELVARDSDWDSPSDWDSSTDEDTEYNANSRYNHGLYPGAHGHYPAGWGDALGKTPSWDA